MKMRIIDNRLFFDEVTEQLDRGHVVRIRARGNSMLPFIRDGRDVLVLEHPGERVFVRGQVLLARLGDGRYVIHRVVKVKGDQLRLRGDGNLKIYETCSRTEVLARVTEVVRGERMLSSLHWNAYRFLWPAHPFLRRVGLAIYRRINKQ